MRLGNPINESFQSLHIGRENSREHRKAFGDKRFLQILQFLEVFQNISIVEKQSSYTHVFPVQELS